jgi:mono/diheme cytochrome c family protein
VNRCAYSARWPGIRILALTTVLVFLVAAPSLAQDSAVNGESFFASNCAACHQADGMGLPGAFPPLAGSLPALVALDGGRNLVLDIVVHGMQGPVTVNGADYNGLMPGWSQLSDDVIAAVINHELTSWGNDALLPDGFEPTTATEVAARRNRDLTPQQVQEEHRKVSQQAGEAAAPAAPAAALQPPGFTAEQAARGHAAYQKNCLDCHGAHLNDGEFGGPPLTGTYFQQRWGSGTVAALYAFTSTQMPPDRPGRLSDQTYADLIAYILDYNGYEAGEVELPADQQALQQMTLERAGQ